MNPIFSPQTSYSITVLEDFLNRIAESLQLDETRRKLVEERYATVSNWIENDPDGFFKNVKFEIYPHGSFSINTTVKPYKKQEFDLDFVVHLIIDWSQHHPIDILNKLEARLRANKNYEGMIKRKNRCIRIEYANDFHMDIMPGCQEYLWDDNRLKVPDRENKSWFPSNPRGYAQLFNAKAKLSEYSMRVLELAYAKQDLPNQVPYKLKLPLERTVQVIKRLRDVYFDGKDNIRTSSIILTTICAQHYQGEIALMDCINGIINRVRELLRDYNGRPFAVPNPANTQENFAEKWQEDEDLFDAFKDFIEYVGVLWSKLTQVNKGIDFKTLELLEEAFGYNRTNLIYKNVVDYHQLVAKANELRNINQAKNDNNLYTTSVLTLTTVPTSIKNQPNRNFGGIKLPVFANKPHKYSVNMMQKHFIKFQYPSVKCQIIGSKLICKMIIKPNDLCNSYKIRIEYYPGLPPDVFIESPNVDYHNDIHMFKDKSLCLYFPPDMKWNVNTKIASYTIPWIAEWVVNYELWKLSERWEAKEVRHSGN